MSGGAAGAALPATSACRAIQLAQRRRTFNVARVDLHRSNYKVSNVRLFRSSGRPYDLHNALPGNNLYGVYGSLENIVPKATFEPYVLWRLAPSALLLPETARPRAPQMKSPWLHWKRTLPANLDYDSEFDWQTGFARLIDHNAWAGYAGVGKTFPKAAGEATSVDLKVTTPPERRNPAGHQWNTFDQLYPSNHDNTGFADQWAVGNSCSSGSAVEEQPTARWKLKQAIRRLLAWRLHMTTSTVAAEPLAVPHILARARTSANELDLVANTSGGQGLNFGFGSLILFAGSFLKTATPGTINSFPYAYSNITFQSPLSLPVTRTKPN